MFTLGFVRDFVVFIDTSKIKRYLLYQMVNLKTAVDNFLNIVGCRVSQDHCLYLSLERKLSSPNGVSG